MVYSNFARKLENELAAAKAERDLAITRVASILWSGAIDKHTCGDVQKWVEDYTAELARLRAERDQLLAVLVHADQILDDIDTCSDAHKPMYSSYSQNVFKLCVEGRDARRAAIDAAMKEASK